MKINCDLGEGLDDIDAQLLPLVDQANIAAGAHAGDEASIRRCVQLAQKFNTEIGIHPSYPDRKNFGRVSLTMPKNKLFASLHQQTELFLEISKQQMAKVSYLKPHGALYNDLEKQPDLLMLLVELLQALNASLTTSPPLALMVSARLKSKETQELALNKDTRLIYEAFADRAYLEDGSLQARKEPGAVLNDPKKIIDQYQSLAEQQSVKTTNGNRIQLLADSVCFHGDNPASQQAIKKIRMLKYPHEDRPRE